MPRSLVLDYDFTQQPELLSAGVAGTLLYLATKGYAASFRTGDFAPLEALARLLHFERDDPHRVLSRCVNAHVLEPMRRDGVEGVRVVDLPCVRLVSTSTERVARHRAARREKVQLDARQLRLTLSGDMHRFSTDPRFSTASTGRSNDESVTCNVSTAELCSCVSTCTYDRHEDRSLKALKDHIANLGSIARYVYALAFAELRAHPELRDEIDQVEHVKLMCARARLPYRSDIVRRAVDAVIRTSKGATHS